MDDIYSMIANLGFPMAVCCYLLIRLEQKLDNLTESIAKLTERISKIN